MYCRVEWESPILPFANEQLALSCSSQAPHAAPADEARGTTIAASASYGRRSTCRPRSTDAMRGEARPHPQPRSRFERRPAGFTNPTLAGSDELHEERPSALASRARLFERLARRDRPGRHPGQQPADPYHCRCDKAPARNVANRARGTSSGSLVTESPEAAGREIPYEANPRRQNLGRPDGRA